MLGRQPIQFLGTFVQGVRSGKRRLPSKLIGDAAGVTVVHATCAAKCAKEGGCLVHENMFIVFFAQVLYPLNSGVQVDYKVMCVFCGQRFNRGHWHVALVPQKQLAVQTYLKASLLLVASNDGLHLILSVLATS